MFSIQLWEVTVKSDLPPSTMRIAYRLSMDGGVVVEGEDLLCAHIITSDRTRALYAFLGFFTDPAFVRQMAEQAAQQATSIAERDQYLRMEAYLPHCEAVGREVVAVLSR